MSNPTNPLRRFSIDHLSGFKYSDLNQLNRLVKDANDALSSHATQLDAANANIATLQAQVAALQTQLQTLTSPSQPAAPGQPA